MGVWLVGWLVGLHGGEVIGCVRKISGHHSFFSFSVSICRSTYYLISDWQSRLVRSGSDRCFYIYFLLQLFHMFGSTVLADFKRQP